MAEVIQFVRPPSTWPLHPWQTGEAQPPGPDSPKARAERVLDLMEPIQRTVRELSKRNGLPEDMAERMRRFLAEAGYLERWLKEWVFVGGDIEHMFPLFHDRKPDMAVLSLEYVRGDQ